MAEKIRVENISVYSRLGTWLCLGYCQKIQIELDTYSLKLSFQYKLSIRSFDERHYSCIASKVDLQDSFLFSMVKKCFQSGNQLPKSSSFRFVTAMSTITILGGACLCRSREVLSKFSEKISCKESQYAETLATFEKWPTPAFKAMFRKGFSIFDNLFFKNVKTRGNLSKTSQSGNTFGGRTRGFWSTPASVTKQH